MPPEKASQSISPLKLVLIGVLSVVLLGVLYFQYDSSEPSDEPREESEVAAAEAAAPQRPQPAAAQGVLASLAAPPKRLPEIELSEIQSHNPFALAPRPVPVASTFGETGDEASAEPEVDPRQVVLARLQQQGVQLVMVADGEPVATIGARQVRVGDVIDGFRVAKIDTQGVVLEEIEGARTQ